MLAGRPARGAGYRGVGIRRGRRCGHARLRRNIQAAFGTQIRMTPLPGRLTEALRLVDELAR
jgi:hypothetical protein